MPGLLAQVSSDVVLAGPEQEPVPDTLLPRLDREVRRAELRRTWLTMGAAAAVVVVITALGAFALTSVFDGGDDPPSAGPTSSPSATAEPGGEEMTRVGQDVLNANVVITSVDWGTKLELTCSYDPHEHAYGEDPPAWTYALVVRTTDGRVEQVGTWTALPGRTMSFTGGTAALADDIASLEVRAPDGTPVLRLAT